MTISRSGEPGNRTLYRARARADQIRPIIHVPRVAWWHHAASRCILMRPDERHRPQLFASILVTVYHRNDVRTRLSGRRAATSGLWDIINRAGDRAQSG